jgi:hypothetical protein
MYDAISAKRPVLARRRAVRLIRDGHRVISSVVHDVFAAQAGRESA